MKARMKKIAQEATKRMTRKETVVLGTLVIYNLIADVDTILDLLGATG